MFRDCKYGSLRAPVRYALMQKVTSRTLITATHPRSGDYYHATVEETGPYEVDYIQDHLNACGLKEGSPWGVAVYRTAFGPGTEKRWERLVDVLENSALISCEMYRRTETLFDRHVLTPIEDKSLSGKSSNEVRDAFRKWSAKELIRWAPEGKIGDPAAAYETLLKPTYDFKPALEIEKTCGPRYNFCLFIDDVCLRSLKPRSEPVVKLLAKHWGHRKSVQDTDETTAWPNGVTDRAGLKLGWEFMRISEYPDLYAWLIKPDAFQHYSRLPKRLSSWLNEGIEEDRRMSWMA